MLHVMIKPPLAVQRQIRGVRAWIGLDDSYPADRLHCTMLRLGPAADWPAAKRDQLKRLLDTVAAEPFQVTFDLIAGNLLRSTRDPQAGAFHRLLRRRAEMCGVAIPHYDFWLHLTLAYGATPITAAHAIDPVGWTVEEFLLVDSDHGHHLLGRWPVRQRQYALAL